MPDQSLDIAIRLLADTHGADQVKAAIASLPAEMTKVASAGKSLADIMGDLREKSQNASAGRSESMVENQAAAIAKAAESAAAIRVKTAAAAREAAAAAGAQAGEQFGDLFNEKVSHKVEKHLLKTLGGLVGVHGLDKLVMAGGAGGAVAAVGLQVLDAAVVKLTEHIKEMQATNSAVNELGSTLRTNLGQSLGPELENTIRHLGDGKNKTLEWVGALNALARAGADAATLGKMADDLKSLNKITGGLNVSTALAIELIGGSTSALQAYGIYIDATLPIEEQLATLREKLALRTSEVGQAAVSAAANTRQFKEAAAAASADTATWATAAKDLAEALSDVNAETERAAQAKLTQSQKDEATEQAENDANLAAGLISEEKHAQEKEKITEMYATRAFDIEQRAREKKIKDAEGSFADAGQNLAAIERQREKEKAAIDAVRASDAAVFGAQKKLRDVEVGEQVFSETGEITSDVVSPEKQAALAALEKAKADAAALQNQLPPEMRGMTRDVLQKKYGDKYGAGTPGQAGYEPGTIAGPRDALTKQMEDAVRAIDALTKQMDEARQIRESDDAKRAADSSKSFFDRENEARKRREGLFKGWQKDADEDIKGGFQRRPMPPELNGHTYDRDGRETSAAASESAAGIAMMVDSMIEVRDAVRDGLSRLRNDGGRIG